MYTRQVKTFGRTPHLEASRYRKLRASNSAACDAPPTGITMYCLPRAEYVSGVPVAFAGSGIFAIRRPSFGSSASSADPKFSFPALWHFLLERYREDHLLAPPARRTAVIWSAEQNCDRANPAGKIQMLQRRMISRSIPYRAHPEMLACVQIDCCDSSIRRLYEREPFRSIGTEL